MFCGFCGKPMLTQVFVGATAYHEECCHGPGWMLPKYEAARAELLQRRCDAYENALEDIRDDAGFNKESGLRAAAVLKKWKAR